MNKELLGLDLVKKRTDDFHAAFGHKVSNKPQPLSNAEILTRVSFIVEELVELIAAVSKDDNEMHLGVVESIIRASADAAIKETSKGFDKRDPLVDVADALTDINVFVSGTFTMLGVEPQNLYDIVMDANMAKLGPDGKPIYRESDGKIMKPEGWAEKWAPEPKIKAEIERQSK